MSLDVCLSYLRAEDDEGEGRREVFSANITHNLTKMAGEAGLYQVCWRPEELGFTKASQLIAPLTLGLEVLRARPAWFRQFDSPNGWGLYKNFLPWVEKYLHACCNSPDADVHVCR